MVANNATVVTCKVKAVITNALVSVAVKNFVDFGARTSLSSSVKVAINADVAVVVVTNEITGVTGANPSIIAPRERSVFVADTGSSVVGALSSTGRANTIEWKSVDTGIASTNTFSIAIHNAVVGFAGANTRAVIKGGAWSRALNTGFLKKFKSGATLENAVDPAAANDNEIADNSVTD